MKLTQSAKLLTLGLILSLAATGCHKKQQYVTPIPGSRSGPPEAAGPGETLKPLEGTQGNPTGEPIGEHEQKHIGWPEDAETLKAQTVYFDIDSSTIKASEKSKVASVADYLKANAANALKVEGHCDERGTEEYNRSLGERRALALREELISIGIGPDRVDTVSYGKDRPADPGHDESAWKMNRRGVFVVLTPPAK